MATTPQEIGTFPQETGTFRALSQTLNGWLRWLRIRRAASWALRGLVLGLALSLAVGLIGLLQARLLRSEFTVLAGLSALIFPLGAALAAYLWPIQPLKAARYFDRVFRLHERVSTALELNLESKNRHSSELIRRQLDDAIRAARMVKPAQALPLRLQTRDGLLALLFILLLGLTWFRGEELFQAAQHARVVEQAAAAQTEKIEEILTQVNKNDALSEDQKRALSAPLEQALNGLRGNPSLESSVSVLTSAGEKLQALSAPQAEQMAQALKEAGSQAAAQEGSPLQSLGQKLTQGNTAAAAAELANTDVSKLSQAQSQELAGQLETMAQTLVSSNPQLATDLNNAAQALRNGDTTQAQQALNTAAQSLAQAGQQAAFSEAASQAAQQMQQGAGQMLAAGGGQQPGQTQGQASNQSGQTNGTGAVGSGQGQPQGSIAGTGPAGSSPIPQGNGPGDGGKTTYEKIYAPTLPGGNDGQTLNLPPSGQDGDTLGQGPTTNSTPGQSLVPYQQVYSQYDQANRQAIENGLIPFEFMQIIRNYFDSLKP